MKPLISLITVVYNGEKTIRRCLRSVEEQKSEYLEYIIIDGASKDNTLSILSSFTHVVDKVISKKDFGIYHAMNRGASVANGEYIGFLNCDDELLPSAIENLKNLILSSDRPDYVCLAIEIITSKGNYDFFPSINYKDDAFKQFNPFPHPGLYVKKEVFHEIGGFDTSYRIAADLDFEAKLITYQYSGVLSDTKIVRFHEGGASSDYKAALKEVKQIALKNKRGYFLVQKSYWKACIVYYISKNNLLKELAQSLVRAKKALRTLIR